MGHKKVGPGIPQLPILREFPDHDDAERRNQVELRNQEEQNRKHSLNRVEREENRELECLQRAPFKHSTEY